MEAAKRGTLLVVSGPSGAGKSTVISKVLQQRGNIYFSVSFTTRAPREGEVDGVNYNYITDEEFEGMIARDEFLEYAGYVGKYYGTSKKVIEEHLNRGEDVLLDIEVQGAGIVREKCPDAMLSFLIPPTFQELERRLRARGTETEEVIQSRLARAREEYRLIPTYDYLVINDIAENAAQEICTLLDAGHIRVSRRLEYTMGVNEK